MGGRHSIMDRILGQIMDYEDGTLDLDGVLHLFCDLLDTGLAWTLQGSYGRQAEFFLRSGAIVEIINEDGRREYAVREQEEG